MFLRHMNRVLVGTMLEVAAGRRTRRGVRARCSTGGRAREAGADRAGARAGAGERRYAVSRVRASRAVPLCWRSRC